MPTSRRILVIEDDVDGRQGLCAILGAWGHETLTAESGRDGFAIALAQQPDVIVLDLGLPDMDGCELVRRVRAAHTHETAPLIVAYTGYDAQEAAAREAGCDAFVLKPGIDELESLLGPKAADGTLRHPATPGWRRTDVA